MSTAPGLPLIQRCLTGILLTTWCTALSIAADSRITGEAQAEDADVQRGHLLYETYCIGCHTTQAHWREKHLVRSWTDLLYQVTRWQKNAGQNWSSEEINDAAAYLNEAFYKMP